MGERTLIQQTVDRLKPGAPARAHLDSHQRSSAGRDRQAASRSAQAPDPRRARPAQHRARHRPRGAHSPLDRSRRRHGRLPRRPRDRQARALSAPCAPRLQSGRPGKHRGAGHPAALGRDRLRLYRIPRRTSQPGSVEPYAGTQLPRKARPANRRWSSSKPAISIGTRACSSGRRRPCSTRCASICRRPPRCSQSLPPFGSRSFPPALPGRLPALREHLHRLRGARESHASGRARRRRYRLERCRQLERRLRTASPATRSGNVHRSEALAVHSTGNYVDAHGKLSPCSASKIW